MSEVGAEETEMAEVEAVRQGAVDVAEVDAEACPPPTLNVVMGGSRAPTAAVGRQAQTIRGLTMWTHYDASHNFFGQIVGTWFAINSTRLVVCSVLLEFSGIIGGVGRAHLVCWCVSCVSCVSCLCVWCVRCVHRVLKRRPGPTVARRPQALPHLATVAVPPFAVVPRTTPVTPPGAAARVAP